MPKPKTKPDITVHTKTISLEPIEKVSPHPDNPRQGDIGAIAESIRLNGWYGAIVCQTSTGYCLKGNHSLQAAIIVGMKEVPVIWIDVDADTAMQILLADNRASDLASYNDPLLLEILQSMSPESLPATLWTGDDIDNLVNQLGDSGGSAVPTFPNPEETMVTHYRCPRCAFEWSGKPKPETGVELE